MIIKVKPLSVNRCWRGRRFKTPEYKSYEVECFYLLPKMEVPKKNIILEITFGVSSKLFDLDNGVKPFIDILQNKYDFNDREIIKLILTKQLTKKGEEFIQFDFN